MSDASDRAWWISWYSLPNAGALEYHGPWWVSGRRLSDMAATIVAAVHAESEDEAWTIVRSFYDKQPASIEPRFCEPLAGDPPWDPDGRFPRADWMEWPVETWPTSRPIDDAGDEPLEITVTLQPDECVISPHTWTCIRTDAAHTHYYNQDQLDWLRANAAAVLKAINEAVE